MKPLDPIEWTTEGGHRARIEDFGVRQSHWRCLWRIAGDDGSVAGVAHDLTEAQAAIERHDAMLGASDGVV